MGDRIESDFAADMDWIVGDIEATAHVDTQEVTGRCFEPGGLFKVGVYRNGLYVTGSHWWTDDEGPTFTFESEWVTFESGDDLLIWCPTGTGDWVRKWFASARKPLSSPNLEFCDRRPRGRRLPFGRDC